MIQTPDLAEVAPDGALHLIETVNAGPSPIERGSEVLCALFLVAMIVLIGAEAIARNVFATSLQITDEIGGYLLVALTFLSMSVAEAHGAFHRVELIQSRLKRSAQLITQMIFDVISLGASLLVTWQLARVAINSWRSEDVAPTPLQTSLWIPQSVMSIGMALLCFALIRTICAKVQHLRGSASS